MYRMIRIKFGRYETNVVVHKSTSQFTKVITRKKMIPWNIYSLEKELNTEYILEPIPKSIVSLEQVKPIKSELKRKYCILL